MGKAGFANDQNGPLGVGHPSSHASSLTADAVSDVSDQRKRDPLEGFPEDCGQYPGRNTMPNPMVRFDVA